MTFTKIAALFALLSLTLAHLHAQIPKSMLIKKWNYAGVEEFGVARPPDDAHKGDFLKLEEDGSFHMISNGRTSAGSWTYDEKSGGISLKDGTSRKTLSYTVKSATEKQLVIEIQTPDLVRTRHQYTAG